MPRSCIDSSWRWRAVRQELTGSPRLVALGVIGVVFLIGGIIVESDGLGTLGIAGAAALIVSLVLPIVSKASVGGGLFSFSFERREAPREEALAALIDEHGATLSEAARWLSGDDARVASWVRQACALEYRDCLLVPRDLRDLHALCLLVAAVRRGIVMDEVQSGDEVPRGPRGPEHLLGIPFDDRAAWVLQRMLERDDADGAQVLHCTPTEFAARAKRASDELAASGGGRA